MSVGGTRPAVRGRPREMKHFLEKKQAEPDLDLENEQSSRSFLSKYSILMGLVVVGAGYLISYYYLNKEVNQVRIFVAGKPQSGKSTLIYGLLGLDENEITLKQKAFSTNIIESKVIIHDIPVTVFEWKSFGNKDQDKEKAIAQLANIDFVLFSMRMDDVILRSEQKKSLRKMSDYFGPDIWRKTVIVLTFANRVDFVDEKGQLTQTKEFMIEKYDHWKNGIHNVMKEELIPGEIIKEIPILPAGYYKKPLLYGESWVHPLTIGILTRVPKKDTIMRKVFNISYSNKEEDNTVDEVRYSSEETNHVEEIEKSMDGIEDSGTYFAADSVIDSDKEVEDLIEEKDSLEHFEETMNDSTENVEDLVEEIEDSE